MENGSSYFSRKFGNGAVHSPTYRSDNIGQILGDGGDCRGGRLNAYIQRNRHTPIYDEHRHVNGSGGDSSGLYSKPSLNYKSSAKVIPTNGSNSKPVSQDGSLSKFYSRSFKYPDGEEFVFRRSFSFCKKSYSDSSNKSPRSSDSSFSADTQLRLQNNNNNSQSSSSSRSSASFSKTHDDGWSSQNSPYNSYQMRQRSSPLTAGKDQFKAFSSIVAHSQTPSPTSSRHSSLNSSRHRSERELSPYVNSRYSSIGSDASHSLYSSANGSNPRKHSSKASSCSPLVTPSNSMSSAQSHRNQFIREGEYAKPLTSTDHHQQRRFLSKSASARHIVVPSSPRPDTGSRLRSESSSEAPVKSPVRYGHRNHFFPSDCNRFDQKQTQQPRSMSRATSASFFQSSKLRNRKNSGVTTPTASKASTPSSPPYSSPLSQSARSSNGVKRNHSFCSDAAKASSRYRQFSRLPNKSSGSHQEIHVNGSFRQEIKSPGGPSSSSNSSSGFHLFGNIFNKNADHQCDKKVLARRRGRSPPRTLEINPPPVSSQSSRISSNYALPASTAVPITSVSHLESSPSLHTGSTQTCTINLQDSYPLISPIASARPKCSVTDSIKSQTSTLLSQMNSAKSPTITPPNAGFDLESLLKIDDLRTWIQELEISRAKGYQTLYSDYDDCDPANDALLLNGKYVIVS